MKRKFVSKKESLNNKNDKSICDLITPCFHVQIGMLSFLNSSQTSVLYFFIKPKLNFTFLAQFHTGQLR